MNIGRIFGVGGGSAEPVGDSTSDEQTVSAEPGDESQAGADEASVVAKYRQLTASLPDLVPELVRGETIEEIDASAEDARRAFRQIKNRIVEGVESRVPVGNPARSSADFEASLLKPEDKIAMGLRGK